MNTKNQYYPQTRIHPGETLEEKLEEMGIGPKEFAVRTGKPEKTIIAIINCDSSITPDMAILFENVTRIPANFWLNSQLNYDEHLAREKNKAVVEGAAFWTKQFPTNDMIKKGWITHSANIYEKTAALLLFFGLASKHAWEDYYLNQILKVNFRISLAHTKEPYAISAWLRKGELQAAELQANQYSEKNFKEALPKLKTVMATHPENFFDKLQTICLEAGVKLVHTPCLPKAPICGSTRRLNDTPLIQLTGRYKRNDSFWFTFFHEAGHILLHGKKDIFLENIDYSDKDLVKEEEANEFARKWTLTTEEQEEIIQDEFLKDIVILKYAQKFNTHPAIIIGRLQHDGYIPYSMGGHFFEPVELS
ncbi:MAG TPA: HigA family addiction module antitoxin [Saprospiraceae bacterium]|nr:HigA family addiction module antitoxin [Saprospiraceae bacterium]